MNIPFHFTISRINNRVIYGIAIMVFILYAVFYTSTLADVPFHPDESTQIFMSADVDTLLTSIDKLYWNSTLSNDLRQHYRLLDAPVTRYLIGTARLLNQAPALPNDWDWSLSWQQNQERGALPDVSLLWLARLSVAWLALISLIFFFDIVQKVSHPLIALLASILLALSPLFLLHTRRAMAESALLFFGILSIWVMLRFPHRPIFIGAVCALAFCSKQSAAVLVFPAILVICMQSKNKISSRLMNLFMFFISFLLVILLLNPFLWKNPLQAAQQAWQQRALLTQQQQELIFERSPEKQTDDFIQKTASLIGALYFQAPAVADVANYLQDTTDASQHYFANPLNNLLHDLYGAIIQLTLGILGLILFIMHAIKNSGPRSGKTLILVTFLCITISLLFFTPFPFQRYYILLLPWIQLWTTYALIGPLTFNHSASGKNPT
mgnify:CR=1 FL=1